MTQPAVHVDDYGSQTVGSCRPLYVTRPDGSVEYDSGFTPNGVTGPFHVVNIKPATVNTLPWVNRVTPPVTNWQRIVFLLHVPGVLAELIRENDGYTGRTVTIQTNYSYNFRIDGPWDYIDIPNSLKARVNQEFLSAVKARGEQYVNLGLAFAERKETEELLVETLKRIRGTIRTFRNQRPREWAKTVRAYFSPTEAFLSKDNLGRSRRTGTSLSSNVRNIPQSWLELQYGWKPLMSDVHDAMVAVSNAQSNGDYIFSVDIKRGQTDPFVHSWGSALDGDLYDSPLLLSSTALFRRQMKAVGRINTQSYATLATVGLANPADLVWERLPFSFVVDWFLPLGNWFNNFDATLGKEFVSGFTSNRTCIPGGDSKTVTFANFTFRTKYLPGFGNLSGEGPNAYRFVSFSREKMYEWPAPQYPALKNPCSPVHVANALSLLATALYSGVPQRLRR